MPVLCLIQMCDGIGENLLSEIKNRPDVKFRLEVFGLYDDSKASQLRIMTRQAADVGQAVPDAPTNAAIPLPNGRGAR